METSRRRLAWDNYDWNAYPSGTSYTINGLEPDTTYKVRVKARFESGPASAWSSAVTVTTPESENIGRSSHIEVPQNVRVTDVSWSTLKVQWNSPNASNITHVKVLRSGGSIDNQETIKTDGSTSLPQTQLAPDANFTYQVSFGTSVTDFGPTAQVVATTLQIPAPTNQVALHVEHNFVGLLWDNPTDTTALLSSIERVHTSETLTVHRTYLEDSYNDHRPFVIGEEYTYNIFYRIRDQNGNYHSDERSKESVSVTIPPAPVLTIADAEATEGNKIKFTVKADRTSVDEIWVNYKTSIESTDTAEADDFTADNSAVRIPGGATSATFRITIRLRDLRRR